MLIAHKVAETSRLRFKLCLLLKFQKGEALQTNSFSFVLLFDTTFRSWTVTSTNKAALQGDCCRAAAAAAANV